MPFPIPLHGILQRREGLLGDIPFEPVTLGELQSIEDFVHFQDGIEGTLLLSCHIARHIDHGRQVLMVDALVGNHLLHTDQFPQGDEVLPLAHHLDPFQVLHARPLVTWEPQIDNDVLFLRLLMEDARTHPCHGHAKTVRNLLGSDPVKRGLFLVHDKPDLGMVCFNIPVDVHHPRGLIEDVPDLAGDLDLAIIIRTVDLGHKGLKNRRSGRDLRYLDPGPVFGANLIDPRPRPLCNLMALCLPFPFGQEVDLNVRLVRTSPEKGVADKTVKIVRRGCPDIHLVVCDLRHGTEIVSDFAGDGCRLLQCGPLGHINDDLEFALVVKGQHLHPNDL